MIRMLSFIIKIEVGGNSIKNSVSSDGEEVLWCRVGSPSVNRAKRDRSRSRLRSHSADRNQK